METQTKKTNANPIKGRLLRTSLLPLKTQIYSLCLISAMALNGCGGSNDAAGQNPVEPTSPSTEQPTPNPPTAPTPPTPPATPPPAPTPVPPSPPNEDDNAAFSTQASTARFLTQATFGPSMADITALTGTSTSEWILAQFEQPIVQHIPRINEYDEQWLDGDPDLGLFYPSTTTFTFWRDAITGPDQLRQRMVFALSQILVVSNNGGDLLFDVPHAVGFHQDNLLQHAFGNYRDLLEAVTYSPGMGFYLTYMGNQKANPETGSMPDENYAREILQLFSIGLVALNMDGSQQLDNQGNPIELFDNDDITGLARVFTGLVADIPQDEQEGDFGAAEGFSTPMVINPRKHSEREKRFLGLTIPPNTPAEQSLTMALDHIMQQPSVAPFISRQLIQRFVTSQPSNQYIERVATAFEQGRYTLPNGVTVGDGRKGDLQSTISAILLDEEARGTESLGKIREPVIRFTNWARAFDLNNISPEYVDVLWDTQAQEALGQHPFRPRSVFNFYRPGYVAPGTATGEAGYTVPELQIMNASSTPGYANFMTFFVTTETKIERDELIDVYQEANIPLDIETAELSFVPQYNAEIDIASTPQALIERLDLLLTYGSMSEQTKSSILQVLNTIEMDGPDDNESAELRVTLAILMLLTSPDFLVQR